MPSNRELVSFRKADLALGDLASGGALMPEQEALFIRTLLVTPTIIRSARKVVMTGPEREISKIGFGSRIMRAAPSNANPDDRKLAANLRAKPDLGKITLKTSKVLAVVNLPYDMIEDNIERGQLNLSGPNSSPVPITGGLKDTLIVMIAERAALDLEELALLGDKTSLDPYLALLDGYLILADQNVVTVNAVVSRTMFANGIKAMPQQYLRNRAALRNYVSLPVETDYRELLGSRETTLGDAQTQGTNPMFAHGVMVDSVALMPAGNGLLIDPNNLLFGIQRNISFEVDKDIEEQNFKIVVSARVAVQIEEVNASVRYDNIQQA